MRTSENIRYFNAINFAGGGFDIYGKHDVHASFIELPFDKYKNDKINTFYFLGEEYALPEYLIGDESSLAYFKIDTVETRDSFQNSIATKVEVAGSYGAFSGQMEVAFTNAFTKNSSYNYSYHNFYFKLGYITVDMDKVENYLSDDFKKELDKLPNNVNEKNLDLFAEFFDDNGTYFIRQLMLGGALEFYMAVNRSLQLSTSTISTRAKIEYNAIVESASVEASLSLGEAWSNYRDNRHTNIIVKGGDPAAVARLINSNNTGDNKSNTPNDSPFSAWADSLKRSPEIVDFNLAGIWKLCGEKEKVVEEAFHLYGKRMRPRMVIEQSPFAPPVILLGSEIPAPPGPDYNHGYRLVLIDRMDVSHEGVKLDKYYSFSDEGDWYDNAKVMYLDMIKDLKEGNYLNSNYFLILLSFGMYDNAPPVFPYPDINPKFAPLKDLLGILLGAGAGSMLKKSWFLNSFPGSTNPDIVSYLLVGIPDTEEGSGIECFVRTNDPYTQEVFFYRRNQSSVFTFGPGESSAPSFTQQGAIGLNLASSEGE